MTNPIPNAAINPVTRHDLLSLLLILVVAAFMRMHDLGRMGEFSYDHATLSILALEMVSGKSLPLTGIESSAGIPNSPMTVYVLAPLFALSDDPQVVTLMIGALNVVGVGLLWVIAHRYFNPRVAIIAGLAYALHPHAVHYSRAIWAQDMHTPILLLSFLLALRGFIEGKRWSQVAALPLFVVGAQIHYAAWTLLPVFLWIVWWGRRRIHWLSLVASIVFAALTLIPFVIGMMRYAQSAGETGGLVNVDSLVLRDKAALYFVRMITGLGGPWVGMDLIGVYDVVLETPTFITALWLLVGATLLLGVVVMWRAWGVFRGGMLALWALLPYLIFLPNWTGVYPHYFIPNLAGFALLVGIGVDWLLARLPDKPPVRSLIYGAFGIILLTQGLVYFAYERVSDANVSELHETPLHYLMDVREALSSVRDVIISGGVPDDSGYHVWKGLLYNQTDCVRELVIAAGGVAIFPDHPFAVITPPGALEPAIGDLYLTDSPVTVQLRPGEGAYRIDFFDAAPAFDTEAFQAITPTRFDNGVQLTGYRREPERVYLQWRLPDAGEQGYSYFAHFLDASGEKIGQQDASFFPEDFWCAGDTILTWIDTDVPPEMATLRVGLYSQRNGQFTNANVVDDSGNPAGLWADIPLTPPAET